MHLLVADDDARLVRLLQRGLTSEGHQVEVAADGARALASALAGDFDVVVLDVMMPELDGLAVVRELRSHHIATPVLLLTARGEVDDRVNGLDAGADDYLVKPFAFEELLARVRALGRRHIAEDRSRVVMGELALDPMRHVATYGSEAIDLTPTEFRLLELFMRHRDDVLTRAFILSQVWGYEGEPENNTVDLYIHYLRRKLGKRVTIATVRGVGYRLEVGT